MAPELILSLLVACAPHIHPETGRRVIHIESRGNPWAIGINGPYRLSRQPNNQAEAVATARMLIERGFNVDMGLAMINVQNLPSLGLTVEQVFDPCSNLTAMEKILLPAYEAAVQKHGPGQRALMEALSVYNTGTGVRGLQNGYVTKIYNVADVGLGKTP